jgi:hypothetical protein
MEASADKFMETQIRLRLWAALPLIVISSSAGYGQLNENRGNAPGNVPQATFFVHQLSTDHAEGITTIDMNGDGRPDILSGAYWYENPGPKGRRVEATPVAHGRDCG